MSASRKIAILLLLAVVICVTESRRGGGGGGGGYRGGSSRSSSSRSSSSRSSSSRYSSRLPRAYNARGWTSRTKTVAMRAGSIYIATRLHRLHYRDVSETYDDSLMSMDICRNIVKYPRFNLTQKVYGWFLCPTSGYADDEMYCCGDEDKEYCCNYWKSGNGIRDIVLYSVFGTIGLIVILVILIKNPGIIEACLDISEEICCCPCRYVTKRRRKMRRRQANQREERRRRREAEDELDRDMGIHTVDGDKAGAAIPPPPSYNACVRKSLVSDEIDVSFNNETPRKFADDQEGNHCEELPYPLSPSSHIEGSAPTVPSSTYRPPSPPSYRSPSPPSYRSPSPPRYRSSSPVCGRSSPGRHSVSSNRS